MRYQMLAILSLSFMIGCDLPMPTPTAPQQPTAPQTVPSSILPPNVIKAENATGVWNQGQVEQFIKQELKLTTIALQSTGNHGYQGTGTDIEGLNYTFNVKQVIGGIKVDWTHSSGKGKITFGNPVP